jgi:hypothetical protein
MTGDTAGPGLLGAQSVRHAAGREGDGIVRSSPRVFLRAEGAVLFALAVFGYARYGSSWWLFPLLLLGPDLSAVGYLAGSRLGAYTYNAAHTYLGPALLVTIGTIDRSPLLLSLGFVWFAHIGMDRAVGYGLKYRDAFAHTHLGMLRGKQGGSRNERTGRGSARS